MKKYLNSPEEVIKALNECKKIYPNGYEEQGYFIEKIDGIICGFNEEGQRLINVELTFVKDFFYTEEPEPIKFEVNRAYKTRGGYKAFLNTIDKSGMEFLSPSYLGYQFFTNGLGLRTEESPFDIVGYWEEEK